ncbi:hypothetical protein ASPBRDRAFT_60249 [Aspergillus brasiliensis CBS 101740]|uniref:Ras-GEF domain-containing protein n=1 Tax=Aspergillus brasiliensis (strain CBS 101740 / IMI 381727 / IBT 21946) TaxID=767769 RepID=A0A1L9U2L3_ASPBC|nr:hypothetical protein ASPBRDRAFT_60249 [Aspergillus brasiliensis CBS 101740]
MKGSTPRHKLHETIADPAAQGNVLDPHDCKFGACQSFHLKRWWEEEALKSIPSLLVHDLGRLIRYNLFSNNDAAIIALWSQEDETIDRFLAEIWPSRLPPSWSAFPREQKISTLINMLHSDQQNPSRWKLDAESETSFKQIPFEEWVRHLLGYHALAVQRFMQQHIMLGDHILRHLRAHPREREKYAAVERHLRQRSPFVHYVIQQVLLGNRPRFQQRQACPPLDVPGFHLLARPIQLLFSTRQKGLTTTLKILDVLSARFEKSHSSASIIDWTRPLDTSMLYLSETLLSDSTDTLVKTLTDADIINFDAFSPADLLHHPMRVRFIESKWHALRDAVSECCAAVPDQVARILEATRALHIGRNYHSSTALLHGLRAYLVSNHLRIVEEPHQNFMSIIEMVHIVDSSNNFATYRRMFEEMPGIPFLLPHCREVDERGWPAVQYMLRYLNSKE